jgi:hypothetical protein
MNRIQETASRIQNASGNSVGVNLELRNSGEVGNVPCPSKSSAVLWPDTESWPCLGPFESFLSVCTLFPESLSSSFTSF